jgi:HTH-type transcriptional regulator/antitoxin HigA
MKPARPGDLLQEELDLRGWRQVDFADILERPVQTINEIIHGKKEITRQTAAQIGAALGTEPEVWLRLQDDYRLWELDQDPKHRAKLRGIRRRVGDF